MFFWRCLHIRAIVLPAAPAFVEAHLGRKLTAAAISEDWKAKKKAHPDRLIGVGRIRISVRSPNAGRPRVPFMEWA